MPIDRKTLSVLFAVAFGLRVLYGAIAPTQLDGNTSPVTRDLIYAQKIASGFEWVRTPASPRSPGYPVGLAILYLLSIKQLWLTLVFQAVLGALTVVVLYRIGARFLGGGLGLIAALWLAVSVQHMHYATLFVRDTLVVLLLLVLVLLLTRPFERMRFGLIAGVLYGALIHVDPQYVLLFPVFAVLVLFFKSRHRILNLQYFFLFTGALVVFSLPWTIRNQLVYNQPIPVGLEASRYFRPLKVFVSGGEETISNIEERIEHAAKSRRIETNTVEFWRVARLRAGTPFESGGMGNAPPVEPAWSLRHNLVSLLNYGLLLPFLVIGVIFVFKDRERTGMMVGAVALAYFLMRAYLGGSERARLPIDPLIILLAFYGLFALKRRFLPGPPPVPAADQ